MDNDDFMSQLDSDDDLEPDEKPLPIQVPEKSSIFSSNYQLR